MSVHFPPRLATDASNPAQAAEPTTVLSGLLMAPVALTPLAVPRPGLSAPEQPATPLTQTAGSASEVRQARFVLRQQALLERLRQTAGTASATASAIIPGNPLSADQRRACMAVLATICTAAAAADADK